MLDSKLQDKLCNLLFFKSSFHPNAASTVLGIKEEEIIILYDRMLLKRVESYVSTGTTLKANILITTCMDFIQVQEHILKASVNLT